MKANNEKIKQEFDHSIQLLRQKKIRITPQRKAVLSYLIASQDHPTVEEIYRDLKPQAADFSLATVYNNVNLLVDQGLVQKIVSSDGATHYDYPLDHHYHLRCRECGKLVDLFYPPLTEIEEFARQVSDFQIEGHHLEVYGLCPDCQDKLTNEAN
ncbi:Fur family transcriptional regulator [Aerococcus kribbianus]|uniref:Fur family transcriptional regulator n=1 Tax=Aerococcus kribbianus TaxID=2999064 RepID=A0A9X3FXF1_9LACT|nr:MULTISPECIES: Fur family transcriptional regulator [unclassified Aerococcus]MCZ0718124.1 Fur family transcriptional regulator [Aerococcus sp. YH-aer221]MCZ0726307.1 Fur family transcriptional regulator [Aerococcus sp. YH-aer222]